MIIAQGGKKVEPIKKLFGRVITLEYISYIVTTSLLGLYILESIY